MTALGLVARNGTALLLRSLRPSPSTLPYPSDRSSNIRLFHPAIYETPQFGLFVIRPLTSLLQVLKDSRTRVNPEGSLLLIWVSTRYERLGLDGSFVQGEVARRDWSTRLQVDGSDTPWSLSNNSVVDTDCTKPC
ncbi:hypothetical protein PM082_015453 [Marasmius tenuissimus]|nr:hypothetical protein PM082_015453 [Marasmius tenuissimus]